MMERREELNRQDNQLTREQWLAVRKEAALKIDPDIAEFRWGWSQIEDPYGVDPNLPPEYDCIGSVYFARSPGSDVWVSFEDLPEATSAALWDRIERGLVCDPCDNLTFLLDD